MNYWESSSFPMEIPHFPAEKLSPSDTASGSRAQSCLPGSPEAQPLGGLLQITFSGPEGKLGFRSHSQGSPLITPPFWMNTHPPPSKVYSWESVRHVTLGFLSSRGHFLCSSGNFPTDICSYPRVPLFDPGERERSRPYLYFYEATNLLQDILPQSKHETRQWRNVLDNISPVLCKTVKIMRTRKGGEILHCGPEGIKELLWPNAVWYPGLDSGKKALVEKLVKSSKVESGV